MTIGQPPTPSVMAMRARDPEVLALLDALTSELAREGYALSQTFGYTLDQLEKAPVHLLGARIDGQLAGLGGLEVQRGGRGELKRFYVRPEHRGRGVADAVITALIQYARTNGVRLLRLETGDKQHAAIAFYRRHGFVETPRFGPYVHSATSYCMQRSAGADHDRLGSSQTTDSGVHSQDPRTQ